ncbi:low-specificity L-threonine aldolase [uncultured Paraglaciecola sp.]|jgi:threonine aldolase|uniref:low-specificity L-threonine aldolase n=1 Tax=uncultured Paraglaciecola sp. TaxID=1765024 RepID=UPI0025EB29C6|nr:low-specificity L-threonine aldolase [uncultured Paraglaciecola sp.]
MKTIDLRSDTVTKPVAEMKQAMFAAQLGDDVYGEDPSVNMLEKKAALLLGKEDAIFCSSGTQSNLIALMAHCDRGDEYIVGQDAHTYKYEAGGAAVLGSIQPQPISFDVDGTLNLDTVKRVIKPDDNHFAKTKLLCLENTIGGKVLPLNYLNQAKDLVDEYHLSFHLDGARLFNAVISQGVDVKQITTAFDSISICLSKGLGAPIGSVLVASAEIIAKARRIRKMLGGGMRQAGMLAAAGIYALDNHLHRLDDDHDNAQLLAQGLSAIEGITLHGCAQTNMLFLSAQKQPQLIDFLAAKNIIISNGKVIRLVTHLDINSEDIVKVVTAVEEFYSDNH